MRTTPASRPGDTPPPGPARVLGSARPPLSSLSRGPAPHHHLSSVVELLEALGHPALVLDRRGRIVAETPAFGALVAEHAEAAAARSLARRLLRLGALARDHGTGPDDCDSRTLIAPLGGHELQLRLLTPTPALARGSAAVVLVAVRARMATSEDFLAAHYRLTAREIPVALLLAQGLSAACIAARLAISAHTVRRHGESVYRKLGVRSRAALATVITRVAMSVTENVVGPS